MSGRRRQFAGLLLVIAVAMLVAACGSGGSMDTTSTATSTTRLPVVTTETGGVVGTHIEATDSTPREYVDAVQSGKPVVILFYVPGAADDSKVLEAVSALQGSYGDYVFLLYDYKRPDAYGDLSMLLKVSYPPELVFVDRTGTVNTVLNGYVDEGTINQALVNLGRG